MYALRFKDDMRLGLSDRVFMPTARLVIIYPPNTLFASNQSKCLGSGYLVIIECQE